MCDSTDLSREESEKCKLEKSLSFSQRFYRIMSSKKMNVLSDKSREELYSMINELKTENRLLKEENFLLKNTRKQ